MTILIIFALAVLSILILIHELGHYLAAKLGDVWVEEFGIGLPPKALGKKIGETIYSINWLPIGGFVRLHGETGDGKVTKRKRAFINKPPLLKVFIVLSGVIMNFLLSALCFSVIFWFTGIYTGVKVEDVLPDSPAYKSGIIPGDIVRKIGNRDVIYYDNFQFFVRRSLGKKVALLIERQEGEQIVPKHVEVDLTNESLAGGGVLGVIFSPIEEVSLPVWQKPFVVGFHGFRKTYEWSVEIVYGIGIIVSQVAKGGGLKGIAGPLGVVATTAEIASYGILPVIEFAGIISVNLALVNLIPFPPLDGARAVLIGVECLFGKKILPKVEKAVYTTGMALLLLLLLILTANEVPKLFSARSLSGFVDSILQ